MLPGAYFIGLLSTQLSGRAKWEDFNIHTRRIVCEREFDGAIQTCGGEQGLIERKKLGRLQGIGAMVDSTLEHPALRMRVQEITLDEKMFESTQPRRLNGAAGRSTNQVRRGERLGPSSCAGIENRASIGGTTGMFALQEHPRMMVGKVKESAGQRDGHQVGRIKAEEPDARIPALKMNVRPDVRLVKVRERRDCGQTRRPHSFHREGHETDVGLPVEKIELELHGNQRTQDRGSNPPVQEHEVTPLLVHHHAIARTLRRCDSVHFTPLEGSINRRWSFRTERLHRALKRRISERCGKEQSRVIIARIARDRSGDYASLRQDTLRFSGG